MAGPARHRNRAGAEPARARLARRLRERRPEIERALLARAYAVAAPEEAAGPEYAEGLRAAVAAALEHGLAGVEHGEGRAPKVPIALLAQARMAARSRVSLDVVLRRYFAGYAVMGDFLIEEAARESLLAGEAMKGLLRAQATIFDRLLAAVGEEYAREERECRLSSPEERRAELVERLLGGELVDASALNYGFDAHHLGAVAAGPGAAEAIRGLAGSLDARLLAIPRGESSLWAWLGTRRALDPAAAARAAAQAPAPDIALALGEPARGLDGWRLTHRQARATLPIAMGSPGGPVRYADVALLASLLQDELLSSSLRRLYLEPLAGARDDGEALREALRAYFEAGRNVSSAAAALGVTRHTISNRLRSVEGLLGRPLAACSADLEAALQLEELDGRLLPRGVLR